MGTATTIAEALEQGRRAATRTSSWWTSPSARKAGSTLTRRLVERYPDLRARVVLISTRREEDFAELIAYSPAAGFLWKAHLSASAVRDTVAAEEH